MKNTMVEYINSMSKSLSNLRFAKRLYKQLLKELNESEENFRKERPDCKYTKEDIQKGIKLINLKIREIKLCN